MIGRRDFIGALGGAAVWPQAARAQQPGVPVIGLFGNGSRGQSPHLAEAFHKGLRETGFVLRRIWCGGNSALYSFGIAPDCCSSVTTI
jgi:hypothetical protein